MTVGEDGGFVSGNDVWIVGCKRPRTFEVLESAPIVTRASIRAPEDAEEVGILSGRRFSFE